MFTIAGDNVNIHCVKVFSRKRGRPVCCLYTVNCNLGFRICCNSLNFQFLHSTGYCSFMDLLTKWRINPFYGRITIGRDAV